MPEIASTSSDLTSDQPTADTKKARKRNALKNLVLTGAVCVSIGVVVNLLDQKFGHDYSTDPDQD